MVRISRYLLIVGVLILLGSLGLAMFPQIPEEQVKGFLGGLSPVRVATLIAALGIFIVAIGFVLIRPRPLIKREVITEKGPPSVSFSSLRIGSTTDVGCRRQLNEDSIMTIEAQYAFESRARSRCVMIVGDGMGGHQKGELASTLGVGVVAEIVQPLLVSNDEIDFAVALRRAIAEANDRILEYSTNHPECAGMGTTLTAAVISESQLTIGHVGDSRAYLIDGNEIMQLTKDHSVVQEMVDRGEITKEQARTHPERNKITRVVGYYGQVESDIYSASLKDGDRVLLCCDGLVIHLTDDEIKQLVIQNPEPSEANARLVALARDRGGNDNISVIIGAIGGPPN